MLKLFAYGLAAPIAAGLVFLLPLVAQTLAELLAFAATTPAGPLLVLLAILTQPSPAPARVIDYSDHEYLAFLLAQEVRYA